MFFLAPPVLELRRVLPIVGQRQRRQATRTGERARRPLAGTVMFGDQIEELEDRRRGEPQALELVEPEAGRAYGPLKILPKILGDTSDVSGSCRKYRETAPYGSDCPDIRGESRLFRRSQ